MSKHREVMIRNCRFNIVMEKDINYFDSHWKALENGEEEPGTLSNCEYDSEEYFNIKIYTEIKVALVQLSHSKGASAFFSYARC